jgi:hypothetical protein
MKRALKCMGKISYTTRADAMKVCASIGKRAGGAPAKPYPCGECSGWHIGRTAVAPARKRKEKLARAERFDAAR